VGRGYRRAARPAAAGFASPKNQTDPLPPFEHCCDSHQSTSSWQQVSTPVITNGATLEINLPLNTNVPGSFYRLKYNPGPEYAGQTTPLMSLFDALLLDPYRINVWIASASDCFLS
jgi:hypothetical protein